MKNSADGRIGNPYLSRRTMLRGVAGACALCVAMGVSSFSYAAAPPAVSPEGLVLVPNTKMAAVYLREGADFSGYKKVALMDCYVAFRKNWKRDQNAMAPFRVDDKDMARIKTELAERLKQVFTDELVAKGTPVTTVLDADVLILKPAIVNLDVVAPDTMEPGVRSFSASAGQMTLFLEIYDGVTGDLLARVIDPERATDFGRVRVRNAVTNRSDADRILRMWAERLSGYFQQARQSKAAVSP